MLQLERIERIWSIEVQYRCLYRGKRRIREGNVGSTEVIIFVHGVGLFFAQHFLGFYQKRTVL